MHKLSRFASVVLIVSLSCDNRAVVIYPKEESITESIYASGIIKSKDQYDVFPAVNGLVAEKLVHEGEIVRKNQPILRLSDFTARLNTEQARATVDYLSLPSNKFKLSQLETQIYQARLKSENDLLLLERQRKLWSQQIGTRNELEQRELACKNSMYALEKAQLAYNDLQKEIRFQASQSQRNFEISRSISADYVVKSSIDGKVYSIMKEKGEMVNTQVPIAMIGSANQFIIELRIDEYDVAKIQTGQKAVIGMDSYKQQVYKAVIRKIKPVMNERSKTFTVEAEFLELPPVLYPNLTCEANILIREQGRALTIPRSCLREGDFVLLSNKKFVKIKTGLKNFEKVEVLEGLSINDAILKTDQ
ncbi:efflux RND transporter periplasmic adaptor subunit [Flavitalea antarctica]